MNQATVITAFLLICFAFIASALHHHNHHRDRHASLSDPAWDSSSSGSSSWAYAEANANGNGYASYGGSSGGCEYSTSSSDCGGRRRQQTFKTVYQDVDGRCVAVKVQEEDHSPAPCNCVMADTCAVGDVEEEPTNGVRVSVGGVGGGHGVNVNVVRRGGRRRRTIGAFLDSVLGMGPNLRSGGNPSSGIYVPGLLDLIPGIDVRVNRHGIFGADRGVSVNVGSRNRPWGMNGIRVNVGGYGNHEGRDGNNCGPTCGGLPGPVASRPTRRRVVTPAPVARCAAGQVCCKSHPPAGSGINSSNNGRAGSSSPSIPRDNSCGSRNACGITSRPAAKKGDAQIGEYPWMAIILRVTADGRKEFLCNAALIDHRRLITVAQCVEGYEKSPEQIEVRLGEHDLTIDNEPEPYQDHQVQSLRIHPQYDNVSLTNDISVITLLDEVKNTIHISPVCLPGERENFESHNCVVTGWGNRQPVLKEFFVECLNDETCVDRLRSTKLGSNYQLHQSFFCAQSTDQSSCLIDGGGPLVCRRKDASYAVIGLISWSVDDYSPDVYVRVQHFLNFIQSDAPTIVPVVTTTTSNTQRTSRSAVPTTTSTSFETTNHQPQQTQQPSTTQGQGQAEEETKTHHTQTGSQETSTQFIEPVSVKPAVPIPPPVQEENQVQSEITGDKKAQAFAWASSSK